MLISILFFVLFLYTTFCSIVSRKVFGFWPNHYVLTNLWWMTSLFLSLYFNNYVKQISDEVYIIFFSGLFSFNSTLFFQKIPRIPSDFQNESYSIKRRRIFEIIVIAAILPMAYTNITMLMSGTEIWQLYDKYWEEDLTEGSYFHQFYLQNIIMPLSTLLITTCFFRNYVNRKTYSGTWNIIIGIIISFLCVAMSAGGRTGVMTLMFTFVLSIWGGSYLKGDNAMSKLGYKYLLIIGIIGFSGIIFLSAGRGDESSLFEILRDRMILFAALFEGYYLETDVCNQYTLGLSMFETPIAILSYPFKFLGLDFERISFIEQQTQHAPALGANSNAAVSAFLYYMRDFGHLGIIVGPVIVGAIYNLLWKYCRKDSFLFVFYIVTICMTCFETIYPFRRGFVFLIVFAFLLKRFMTVHKTTKLTKHDRY